MENDSCCLDRICGCFYVHFEAVLDFPRKDQMGCLEAFRDNTNGAKHPHKVTSNNVGFLTNVSGENMTRPGEVRKGENVPRIANIESYNTRFRTFPVSEFLTPRDAS